MQDLFTILQGSDLPRLTLQCLRKPADAPDKLKNLLLDVEIFFSMADVKTGEYYLLHEKAHLLVKPKIIESMEVDEYFLQYRFSKKTSRRAGRYRGEFLLKFYKTTTTTDALGNTVSTRSLDGEMKLPGNGPLYIEVKESIV